MDFELIESFLKDTIWGTIILGTLGSGLLLLILNLAGRANKKFQGLRIYYFEGNEEILEKLKTDKEYLQIVVFIALSHLIFMVFGNVIVAIIIILARVDVANELHYKILFPFTLVLIIVPFATALRYRRLINKYRRLKSEQS